jgi:hypothetical protein
MLSEACSVQRYEPFFDDFGPVHVGMLYRFCTTLEEKLKDRHVASTPSCVNNDLLLRPFNDVVLVLQGSQNEMHSVLDQGSLPPPG